MNTIVPLLATRPVLPEWTRWSWSSMDERAVWSVLNREVGPIWERVEYESVLAGIRPALYKLMEPLSFLSETAQCRRDGLAITPIDTTTRVSGAYSAAPGTVTKDNIVFRVLISRPRLVEEIQSIPDLHKDNEALGRFLGYPQCCRDFFARTWGAGQIDTTWDQFLTTGNADGPIEANLLWRWLGIRWVFHLPCSYQCEHTVKIGQEIRALMQSLGHREEARTIDAVLSWPTTWSGVNGIAEIVGPCVKVSTRTDWAPPTDGRHFDRSGTYEKPQTKEHWVQNGFKNYDGMRSGHNALIPVIAEFTPQNGAVYDLGCGNGALLKRVKLHRPDLTIGGIDTNTTAIQSAAGLLTGSRKWMNGRIQDLEWVDGLYTDTVLFYSPARLVEMSPDEREATLTAIKKFPVHIVCVYDDHLQRGALDDWCRDAGLPVDKLLVVCGTRGSQISIGILRLG